MVLLDILAKQSDLELFVAHFNHEIRGKSIGLEEEKLVSSVAKKYGLKFQVGRGNLGAGASEEGARRARYAFLQKVKKETRADAIITAHHQDDLIETALINTLRGTGRRGLSAIAVNPQVIRPLLGIPKKQLVKYAQEHKLAWSEDITNTDTAYLRNYLRQELLPELKKEDREALIQNIQNVAKNQPKLEKLIATLSQKVAKNGKIDRQKFNNLPAAIAREAIAFWLRDKGLRDYDKKMIETILIAIKTSRPGTSLNIKKSYGLQVDQDTAQISNTV